jgi:hypothetical protein
MTSQRTLIPLALAILTVSTLASPPDPGFAIKDLRKLKGNVATVLGPGYIARVDSARITLMCASCAAAPAIDVLLGRQNDGTEARVRAGTTTIAQLDSTCRSRSPTCRIAALRVTPAVGWISGYRFGSQFANTVVVIRDGDLLTVRSIASDSATARRNADRMVARVVPLIVGR